MYDWQRNRRRVTGCSDVRNCGNVVQLDISIHEFRVGVGVGLGISKLVRWHGKVSHTSVLVFRAAFELGSSGLLTLSKLHRGTSRMWLEGVQIHA